MNTVSRMLIVAGALALSGAPRVWSQPPDRVEQAGQKREPTDVLAAPNADKNSQQATISFITATIVRLVRLVRLAKPEGEKK